MLDEKDCLLARKIKFLYIYETDDLPKVSPRVLTGQVLFMGMPTFFNHPSGHHFFLRNIRRSSLANIAPPLSNVDFGKQADDTPS
jgi:hypothetical protein